MTVAPDVRASALTGRLVIWPESDFDCIILVMSSWVYSGDSPNRWRCSVCGPCFFGLEQSIGDIADEHTGPRCRDAHPDQRRTCRADGSCAGNPDLWPRRA